MSETVTTQPVSRLARPVTSLFGVGPERARQLERLEIRTIEDLLLCRPRRYEDRREVRTIADLRVGEGLLTRGTVVTLGVKWFHKHTKSIFELILSDGTARLHCRWWNLPYMERYFTVGDEVIVFGRLQGLKPRTMDHPETEVIESGEDRFIHFNRITPVYPLTEGLPQRWLRGLVWRTLEMFEGDIADPWQGDPWLRAPAGERSEAGASARSPRFGSTFPSRAAAIRMLHFPETQEQPEAARRRLALDEFVGLQQQIQVRRRNFESKSRALACGGNNRLIKPFLSKLGFKLTEGQTRVLRELRKGLAGRSPMRRLLQGEVGSGKTVVAGCCALMAIESGYDVALMAPTEILAEQHFRNFSRWFEPLGITLELRTGSQRLVQGQPPGAGSSSPVPRHTLFVGTHALLESDFRLENLGLAIIDEQHKFGVSQREQFVRKGVYPHLLVMTATPIPRTLGLTIYGELDVSVIGGMPPGRGQVRTFVRSADTLPKIWEFIHEKLAKGRQAYIVYPRVEDSGPNGVKSVTTEFENLRRALSPFEVGMLHGKLNSQEKERVMSAFRDNRVQALLATSLIEVGVDVPNASVMLVENAEQFGLAQLHQLRGRIGRGSRDAYCILVAAAKTPEARRRLRVLEETNDGFRIAEEDLKLRGPGELLGREQSGMPKFRFGDLVADLDLIEAARRIAAPPA